MLKQLKEIRKMIYKPNKNINRTIEIIKKKKNRNRNSWLKNTIIQLKNSLEDFNSRCKHQKKKLNEDWSFKIIKCEEQKEKKRIKKSEQKLRELMDTIQQMNTHVIGIPEEQRQKGSESLFEDITTGTLYILGKM